MTEQEISEAIDAIANSIEDAGIDFEDASENLGLGIHEVIDRVAVELKARFPEE